MDLRDLVRQSTRARQKLALLWLASRGAHIPKFLPPPSHAGRRSTPSPRLSPPHECAGAAPSRPLARSRLSEINFPKSPLGERLPGFSFEKNGFTGKVFISTPEDTGPAHTKMQLRFTRVKVARGPEL